MYNIDHINHTVFELSDFLEYKSVINNNKTCSINDLRVMMSAPEDEIDINGTEEGDDKVINQLQEALNRCSIRRISEFFDYPFLISNNSISCSNFDEDNSLLYIFLLFANRLNMQRERVQGDIDATKLFERLCRVIANEYFGEHSICEIFGTAINVSFEDKVRDILNKLNIVGDFKQPFGGTGYQKDGGVDLVAWIPFKDKKDSQLIALGQCKTGSNWEPLMKKIAFFDKYSTTLPFMGPVYMFFVAEDLGIYKWEDRCRDCGILFDRKRIMEFLPKNFKDIHTPLFNDIKRWVCFAISYLQTEQNQA